MATLNDLPNKSISSMNNEDLLAHIMAIRSSRRIPKKPIKKSSTPKKVEKTTGDILGMLSPQQAELLLKKLEGES